MDLLYSLNRMKEPGVWFNESTYYCTCGPMELVTVPHAVYSDFELLLSDAPTTSGAYSNFAILRWLTEFTVTGACGKLRRAISLRLWWNLRLWQIRTNPFDIEVANLGQQNSSHELLQASAD